MWVKFFGKATPIMFVQEYVQTEVRTIIDQCQHMRRANLKTILRVDISHSIEHVTDEKYYQRGSIEKDGNVKINSATIQYEEISISRT